MDSVFYYTRGNPFAAPKIEQGPRVFQIVTQFFGNVNDMIRHRRGDANWTQLYLYQYDPRLEGGDVFLDPIASIRQRVAPLAEVPPETDLADRTIINVSLDCPPDKGRLFQANYFVHAIYSLMATQYNWVLNFTCHVTLLHFNEPQHVDVYREQIAAHIHESHFRIQDLNWFVDTSVVHSPISGVTPSMWEGWVGEELFRNLRTLCYNNGYRLSIFSFMHESEPPSKLQQIRDSILFMDRASMWLTLVCYCLAVVFIYGLSLWIKRWKPVERIAPFFQTRYSVSFVPQVIRAKVINLLAGDVAWEFAIPCLEQTSRQTMRIYRRFPAIFSWMAFAFIFSKLFSSFVYMQFTIPNWIIIDSLVDLLAELAKSPALYNYPSVIGPVVFNVSANAYRNTNEQLWSQWSRVINHWQSVPPKRPDRYSLVVGDSLRCRNMERLFQYLGGHCADEKFQYVLDAIFINPSFKEYNRLSFFVVHIFENGLLKKWMHPALWKWEEFERPTALPPQVIEVDKLMPAVYVWCMAMSLAAMSLAKDFVAYKLQQFKSKGNNQQLVCD